MSGITEKVKDTGLTAMDYAKEATQVIKSKLTSGPTGQRDDSKKNKGVLFTKTGTLEVQDVGYPTFRNPVDKSDIEDGVILKVVASGICGSDRHTIHGRHADTKKLVLGHEFTGEVVEKGPAVKYLEVGDLVSVPFNVSCGHCMNCKRQNPNICLRVNNMIAGGAYGYAVAGGWHGGQAEYVMVPFADWNCLKFPDAFKAQAWQKMLDLSLITDVLPTAMHGAVEAGVSLGKTVFIAGAGPVGLACAAICHAMGAAEIFIGDVNPARLEQAKKHIKCHTIDFSKYEAKKAVGLVEKVTDLKDVDCGIDCVGYEAEKTGSSGGGKQNPAEVLNFLFQIVRAGGCISVPGVYLSPDPKGVDSDAKMGFYTLGFSMAWIKGIKIMGTGQCPVMKYNRDLMIAILHDRLTVKDLLNIQVIGLDDVPEAFDKFDKGLPVKYIIDPHGLLREKTLGKQKSKE